MADAQQIRGARGLLMGFACPFRGALFVLGRPATWGRAAVPALVNGLVLLLFVGLALLFLDDLRDLILPASLEAIEGWKGTAVTIVASVLSFVGCLAAAVIGGLLTAAILAGPFAELLSERIEALYRAVEPEDPPFSMGLFARDAARGALGAVGRLLIFGCVYIPLLLASLLPVIGLLFAALTLVYSAFFLAMNFVDPILDRRRLTLGAKVAWARRNLAPWLGFGAASFLVLFIPVANLVIAPALVAGGTLLYVDVEAASAPE
jgi:CysZ protein